MVIIEVELPDDLALALAGGDVTIGEVGCKTQNLEDVFLNVIKESNHEYK